MNKNLGKQVRSGFGWDLIGTFFKQISVLTVSVVLARLLSPEEFGIIGMAMVFVNLSQVFVEVGFSQGLIQKQNNTQIIYSSVFFINIFLGLFVGAFIYVLAPLIGNFYESSQVTSVVQWLCFIPLISSFGSVHNALFVKNLNFKLLAFRTIFSTLIGGSVGVVMAFLGYGVYAIVGQQISTVFFFSFILWWKSDWRPSWVFSLTELKELSNFSAFVFLDNLFRRFFLQLDTLFIGKYFSATTLGFYSRASSLNQQINGYTTNSLRKVLFPTFSKLQDDPKLFKSSYFKVFEISIFFGSLITGCCFFLAEDIIITLLGEKWQPSVLIFQILVFKTIFQPFGALIGKSLLAMGFSKENFKLGLIRRVILLSPLYIGYLEGIHAFTIALVIAFGIAFLISLGAVQKYLNFSFTKQLCIFIIPLLPLMFMVTICYLFKIDTNTFVLFLTFLVTQFIYLFTIKNKGLYLCLNLIKSKKKMIFKS